MNLVHTLSHSIGVLATESGPNNGPGAWMPELRGILTVIIGVFVLMGSVYFIMMTNMGARLAFLVAFSGLAGWMFLMAAIWWTYGIGLKGAEPSWDPMPGKTVLQDPQALVSSGALGAPVEVADDPVATAAGWAPWVDRVVRWLTEGRSPTVFVHTPDNVDAPVLARRFHEEVRARIPGLAALPDPLLDARLF